MHVERNGSTSWLNTTVIQWLQQKLKTTSPEKCGPTLKSPAQHGLVNIDLKTYRLITEGIQIIVPGLNDTGDNKISLKANVLIAKDLWKNSNSQRESTEINRQVLSKKACPPLFINSAKPPNSAKHPNSVKIPDILNRAKPPNVLNSAKSPNIINSAKFPNIINSAKSPNIINSAIPQNLSRVNNITVTKNFTTNLTSCSSNLTKIKSSEKIGATAYTTEKCSILNNLNTLVVDEQKYHRNDVLDTKTADSDFPNFGKLNNFYPIQEFDDKDQECLIDFDQLDDIEDKVSLTTTIKNQSKNINLSPNYHNTSPNYLEDEDFIFKMENFSADFDSSSIFGGDYYMDELMLPDLSTNDFNNSLPVVYYDINEYNNSIIEYIDPTTLTTTKTQDGNIEYDLTTLENVFETNEVYHNDQAINISEDKSPNLYLNDMTIDNNNIILTSNNNNNHYNNNKNMMVTEELNHTSEPPRQNSDDFNAFTLNPLRLVTMKDDYNNNNNNTGPSLATPDIANQIFDLESNNIILEDEEPVLDNFDLIEYITSPNETMTSFDDDVQEPPTPPKMTTKRKFSEYQETSSTCSSIGSPAPSSSKKRRGRPPKPLDEIPEIPVDNLNDNDIKYLEMRNKNNLASRRSRMNRKHREIKDEVEANKLEDEYQKLLEQENELIKECGKWKRAVMRLAAL